MKNWPIKRRRQLAALRMMLFELQQLDNGSHFTERVRRCMREAAALTASNLNTGEPDFIGFLTQQAVPNPKVMS